MKKIKWGPPSVVACVALSVLAGVTVFLLGVGLDHTIRLLRMEHSEFVGVVRLLRDGIMACFVLLLVLTLLNAQRRARERAGGEIALILEINDSVRNALQIIPLSFSHPDEIRQQIKVVDERLSLARLRLAAVLNEVLGRVSPQEFRH